MPNMYKSFLSLISILAVAITLMLVIPDWKEAVKNFFSSDRLVLLAELESDIRNDGTLIRVSKIEINRKLYLKFFEKAGDIWRPIQTITLPDTYDGYASIAGDPKNLALVNLDDDGYLEVIAPTFDRDMIAYLNVYKYQPGTKTFVKVPNGSALLNQ